MNDHGVTTVDQTVKGCMELKWTVSVEEDRTVKQVSVTGLCKCGIVNSFEGLSSLSCHLMGEALFLCAGLEGEGPLQRAELPCFPPGIQITEMTLL